MKRLLLLAMIVLSTSSAQQQATVKGRVLGADGKPMPMAHLTVSWEYQSSKDVPVAADGSFRVEVEDLGRWDLKASGVNHVPANVVCTFARPGVASASIRLKANERMADTEELFLIGNFNHFDFFKDRIPMKKLANGTWKATVKTDSPLVRYQVFDGKPDSRSMNGTMAERYEPDGGGDYICVVTPKNRRATIIYDPSLIPASNDKERIEFDDPLNRAVAAYQDRVVEWNAAIMRRPRGTLKNAQDSLKTVVDSVFRELWTAADRESDSSMRDCGHIQALEWKLRTMINDSDALQFVRIIRASSRVWSGNIWIYGNICDMEIKSTRTTGLADAFLDSEQPAYEKECLLINLLACASSRKDSAFVRQHYARYMRDYAKSDMAFVPRMMYNYDSKSAPGKRCPAFAFKDLDDSTRTISDAALKGKVTLLHFWGPGIEYFIPELESLYEQYAKDGLEIVSFGLHLSREETLRYRKTRSAMPWHHVLMTGTWDAAKLDVFDVPRIPYMIFLDRDGTVRMSGPTFGLKDELALEVRAAVLKGKE